MSRITSLIRLLKAIPGFLLVAVLVGLVSACGGDDDNDSKTATATANRTGGASATAIATNDGGGSSTAPVQINETVYHAGFKLDLGEASLEDNVVKIAATFENLASADNATLDSRIALRSGGVEYTDIEIFEQDIPAVTAKGSLTGNFAIRVNDNFTFDDATLIIGHPDNNQAIVPIGINSPDELVTLAPVDLTIAGQAVAGPVVVDLEGGEIRADLPEKYNIADKDHLELTVRFSVTPGTGIPIGQGVFQDPNVKLKTPDGKTIAIRNDGVSGVNELLQGKEGTTISDLSVRFEAPKPASGQYTFIVTGTWGPSAAVVTGQATFTVPALPTLGE